MRIFRVLMGVFIAITINALDISVHMNLKL